MPPDSPSVIWQIAERFGFPAAVCACLGIFIWVRGREIAAELGRLTRAVTLLVLSMQFAPQFHDAARDIYDESIEAARKRKESLEGEIRKHRP